MKLSTTSVFDYMQKGNDNAVILMITEEVCCRMSLLIFIVNYNSEKKSLKTVYIMNHIYN